MSSSVYSSAHVKTLHLGLRQKKKGLWTQNSSVRFKSNRGWHLTKEQTMQVNFIRLTPEQCWHSPHCWQNFCWRVHYFVYLVGFVLHDPSFERFTFIYLYFTPSVSSPQPGKERSSVYMLQLHLFYSQLYCINLVKQTLCKTGGERSTCCRTYAVRFVPTTSM